MLKIDARKIVKNGYESLRSHSLEYINPLTYY